PSHTRVVARVTHDRVTLSSTRIATGGSSGCPTRRYESRTTARLASDSRHVLGRGTFLALHDLELDALTLGQRLEAVAVDGRMMDEAILRATLRSDEAEAFGVVEPLDCSCRTHGSLPVVRKCCQI